MTYSLNARTLQKISPKNYTDGTEQWRARSIRNVSASTQRNSDTLGDANQRAQFHTPSSTTTQAKVAMRDLNEGKSTPASATKEMCKPKTFTELLESKTDDGTLAIAKTRERKLVKYRKRLGIDDE